MEYHTHETNIKRENRERERERERERWKYNGPGYGKYFKHIQFGFRWNKVEGEKACNLMMINASHY